MLRTNFFSLKVSYWPSATEAGKRPVQAVGGFVDDPQYYRPHTFNFRFPPSREDFFAVAAKLPWAQGWLDNGLRQDIDRSEWPIVDFMHKAASTEIMNDGEQVVGELRVHREERWENKEYDRGMVAVHLDDLDGVVNRLPKAKRDVARAALRQHENRV
jgi:hypothetical protein